MAPGARGGIVDPRPLKDKHFIKTQIQNLITFMAERNFEGTLSPALLQAPTCKLYFTMAQFLFEQLDPNFVFANKPEDDICMYFKKLQ